MYVMFSVPVVKVSLFFTGSGVIQEGVEAHGQIVMAWHVTTGTSAHVETRVTVGSALALLSLVTQIVSTVMATAAVLKLDLDLSTTSANVK